MSPRVSNGTSNRSPLAPVGQTKRNPAVWLVAALLSSGAVVALGLALAVYAFFIEPYHLEVTHLKLPIRGLKARSCPIRIVHFADVHSDPTVRLEEELPRRIAEQKPDIILYTGDTLNSVDAVPICRDMFAKIRPIAPLFCVKGDWDLEPDLALPVGVAGVQFLNGYKVLNIRGSELCIIGNDCFVSQRQLVDSTRKAIPAKMPAILITHQPDNDVVMSGKTAGVDLLLCGHTHGGQVALPFFGPIVTHSRLGTLYAVGLNRLNDMWIYTNRGIGMEGRLPRVRFCAPPELTVIDLVPASN